MAIFSTHGLTKIFRSFSIFFPYHYKRYFVDICSLRLPVGSDVICAITQSIVKLQLLTIRTRPNYYLSFVKKITKTTENFIIKYKYLYFNDLYLIFHRFFIFFIELIRVDEVLPDDVRRGSDGGNRVEERLGHPDGEDGVFLPEGLAAGGGIAEMPAHAAPDLELHKADDQRSEGEPHFDGARDVVQVDDESRRPPDDDDEGDQPQVERNLPVVADPPRYAGHDEAAELRGGERQDQQRRDAGKNLHEGAGPRAGEGEYGGRHERYG